MYVDMHVKTPGEQVGGLGVEVAPAVSKLTIGKMKYLLGLFFFVEDGGILV